MGLLSSFLVDFALRPREKKRIVPDLRTCTDDKLVSVQCPGSFHELIHIHVYIPLIMLPGCTGPCFHRIHKPLRPRLHHFLHLLVYHLRRLARQPEDLPKSINVQPSLHRDQGDFAAFWHDGNRKVRHVVLFERREVEHGRSRMHAAGDGTDEIEKRDARADKRERRRIDTCLRQAAVLLEDVDVDVYLGARVEGGLHDGFKSRLYGRPEL